MHSKIWVLIFSVLLTLAAFAGSTSSVEIPQGRIWRLLEAGYTQQAELLEESLEEYLKTSPLKQVAYLGGGISSSFLVKFDHNVYAVLKLSDPNVPDSYLHEVAAYKLDRLLGLHMVPLTVVRKVNGQLYSLQLYYPGEGSKTESTDDFQKRRDDLRVFDYLISQGDRQGNTKNTFIAEDGRRIAIDQARVFLPYTPEELSNSDYGQPSDELKLRILNVKEKEIRRAMKGLLSEEKIRQILTRLAELKDDFNKQPLRVARSKSQKEPWPLMKDEFKAPENILHFEFWDQFGVWKTLTQQTGKSLTPDAHQMIQENSKPSNRKKLLGFVFQRWFHFTPEVKKELLSLLWSPEAAILLKKNLPTLRDVLQMDPSKAKEIPDLQDHHRHQAAPACVRIHRF